MVPCTRHYPGHYAAHPAAPIPSDAGSPGPPSPPSPRRTRRPRRRGSPRDRPPLMTTKRTPATTVRRRRACRRRRRATRRAAASSSARAAGRGPLFLHRTAAGARVEDQSAVKRRSQGRAHTKALFDRAEDKNGRMIITTFHRSSTCMCRTGPFRRRCAPPCRWASGAAPRGTA